MKKVFLIGLLSLVGLVSTAQAVKVDLKETNGVYQVFRGGKPYYIKGAGGQGYLDKLVESGGNSIRTWSLDNAKEVLDEAQKRGLTVMMGLWVQHERHGFDYNDTEKVAEQLAKFKKGVLELKDHPALLLWGIGNEVNLEYTNTKVWAAIQDIAKMCHEVDPNHLTTTVTAGVNQDLVKHVQTTCPDIDVFSVNVYGDAPKVPSLMKEYGWKGAYMITEWGPNGHWEVAKAEWGAPFEQTSTEKSVSYRERHKIILEAKDQCVGSYVFVWGDKQERTPTWYGVFLKDGEESEVIDMLELGWSGKLPSNLAPSITPIVLNGKQAPASVVVKSNEPCTAVVTVKDPDKDVIEYKTLVMMESTSTKSGGDQEDVPPTIDGLDMKMNNGALKFKAPKEAGNYRLFIYAFDGNNNVATANLPFQVK